MSETKARGRRHEIPRPATPPPKEAPPQAPAPAGKARHSVSFASSGRQTAQFRDALSAPVVDLEKLRSVSWAGIPDENRASVWRLFLDYEPVNARIRETTLNHKRADYFDCLNRVYGVNQQRMWTNAQKGTQAQILLDLPRTKLPLLRLKPVQDVFERVLFVWSVRHPASGYVQGMNDLVMPFFCVFLSQFVPAEKLERLESIVDLEDVSVVTEEAWREIEADCFWCFSKLLDGIQDVYTKDQPGLYKMLETLASVMKKSDPELAGWIEKEEIRYEEFAFRWVNCLLVREFSLKSLYRLWDMYLAQHTKIAVTHVYVCAALLNFLSPRLVGLSHADFVMQVQSISPSSWTIEEVDMIIAQGYVYEKMFVQQLSNAARSVSMPSFRKK